MRSIQKKKIIRKKQQTFFFLIFTLLFLVLGPIVPTESERRAGCIDSHAAICSADTLISLACINKRLTPVNGICPRTYTFSPDGVLSFALLQPLPQARNLRDCLQIFESSISNFPKVDKSGKEIWPQMIWKEGHGNDSGGCSMAGTYPWKTFLYVGTTGKVASAVLRLVSLLFLLSRFN